MRIERERETVKNYITNVIFDIDTEIAGYSKKRHHFTCLKTLCKIKELMKITLNCIDNSDIPRLEWELSGLTKHILDSWPMDSELGGKIIRVKQLYIKYKYTISPSKK